MKYSLLFLLPAVFLFACDPKPGTDSEDQSPADNPETDQPTLISDEGAAVPLSALMAGDSVLLIEGEAESPEGKITISTVVPHAKDEDLNRKIQTYLGQLMGGEEVSGSITNLEQELRTFIRNDLKNYRNRELMEDTASVLAMPYSYLQVYDYKTEVVRNTGGILSLSTLAYFNTGGAHPNYYNALRSFSTDPARELQLTDVFAVSDTARLRKLLDQKVDHNNMYDPGETVPLTGNFLLTETGVRFNYMPYEIGPWAVGEFEFEVPYAELEGMMVASENW